MNEAALDLKKCKAQALNYAAADVGLTKVTHGIYDNAMTDAQEKYSIPESVTFNKKTVEL